MSLSDIYALKLKILKTWQVIYQKKEHEDVHHMNQLKYRNIENLYLFVSLVNDENSLLQIPFSDNF